MLTTRPNHDYDYSRFLRSLPPTTRSADIIPEIGIKRSDLERIMSYHPRPRSPPQFVPETLPRPGAANHGVVKQWNQKGEKRWAEAWEIVDQERVVWAEKVRMEILEQQKQDVKRRKKEEELARRQREIEQVLAQQQVELQNVHTGADVVMTTTPGRVPRHLQIPIPNTVPCESCTKRQVQCMGKPGHACTVCSLAKTRCSLSKVSRRTATANGSDNSKSESLDLDEPDTLKRPSSEPDSPRTKKIKLSTTSPQDDRDSALGPSNRDLTEILEDQFARHSAITLHVLEKVEALMTEQRNLMAELLSVLKSKESPRPSPFSLQPVCRFTTERAGNDEAPDGTTKILEEGELAEERNGRA